MFQTPILDVAVGLIVVYIMLALACTSFNEWLAQALSFRAQTLKKVLLGLFGSDQQGLQFAKNLYEHPIFDSLTPGRPGSLPEFVPANLFSLALADHLELTPRVSPAASTPDKGTDAANSAPAANAEAQVTPPTTDSIINAINDAPLNDKQKQLLLSFVVGANDDLDKFRGNVENWFNAAMDRASDWYKKRTQITIFFIAIIIVSLCNADTIMIVNRLWTNPVAREKMIVDAKGLAKEEAQKLPGQPTTTNPPGSTGASNDAASQDTFALMGWPTKKTGGTDSTGTPADQQSDSIDWTSKIIGLLITAFAASLGAPFWFDMLNKLTSIRNAVVPATPSPAPSNSAVNQGQAKNGV